MPSQAAASNAADFVDRDDSLDDHLTSCDTEKIHEIEQIQSGAGNILLIESANGRILAHDCNIMDVPWIKRTSEAADFQAEELTDKLSALSVEQRRPSAAAALSNSSIPSLCNLDWQSLLPPDIHKLLSDAVQEMNLTRSKRSFRFFTYEDENYAISLSKASIISKEVGIEIERNGNSDNASNDLGNLLGQLGRIIEVYDNETIAFTACDTIFDVMRDYDRGMVYKFNDDLSGEIVHEVKKEGVETSYLGLRFPAGDIPLSSRELYKENGLRYILDSSVDPVPLTSLSAYPMDMSQIRMRAVSKVHIIYMRNMGVRCSMSIAIVVDNELWGLLAFHGYKKPFKPQLHQRIACETISKMVSVKIDSVVKKAQSSRIVRLSEAMLAYQVNRSLIQNLYESSSLLLDILDCEVLVVNVLNPLEGEGDSLVLGDRSLVPKDSFWGKMSDSPNQEIVLINKREELKKYSLGQDESPSAGFAFFREGRTQFMLGRALRSKDVRWGGNPDEPKLRIGGILSPRRSFESFMTKARLEARAWSTQDVNVLTVFRDRMCEHSLNWMMNVLRHDIADTNKKYLDAIDRAQENYDFFARMSHELRTPFHGVVGCLGILEESDGDMTNTDSKSIVKTALSSANHMINLLNDILDVSKNEHLCHTVSRTSVIFQTLAFETYDCMKPLAATQHVDLIWEVTPNADKIVISTDRTKVIQVVSNLVNNAVKFTETDSGRIKVRFALEPTLQQCIDSWAAVAVTYQGSVFSMSEGDMVTAVQDVQERVVSFPNPPNRRWICVTIQDNGCGMIAENLIEMFSPYTQASTGPSRGFQGTGLGLFICVSLCIQMKGYIACSSTPGTGTVFQIGIPVYLEDPGSQNLKGADDMMPSSSGSVPLRKCILVADDNKINVAILKRSLENQLKKDPRGLDVEILTAYGGAEALAIYKERLPSPCFIDYHMPDMDGLETTTAIRQFEEKEGSSPTYVLSYTADATDRARELLFNVGVNEIMLKPPPQDFLKGLISRLSEVST